MARDHYVSQTYLRGWQDSEEQLHAIRKKDLKQFKPKTRSVCFEEDGNTNEYLAHARAIEAFIKPIEDRYSGAVRKISERRFDVEDILTVAAWISYVETSAPTARRLGVEYLRPLLEMAAVKADREGHIPPPPPELGGTSLRELLVGGKIRIDIDESYPQAIGASHMQERVATYSNWHWAILYSCHADSPFLTSDFPIAIDPLSDLGNGFAKVVPLSPTTAVRIRPRPHMPDEDGQPPLRHFQHTFRNLSRAEVRRVNTMVVRTAENLVFSSGAFDWLARFVSKHAHYRATTKTEFLGPTVRQSLQVQPVDGDLGSNGAGIHP